MKKLAFVFAFLVGSMSLFANEVVTKTDAAEYLLDIEVPLEIGMPDGVFVLSDLVTNNTVFTLLDKVVDIIDDVAGLFLPDKITLDILGVPDGLIIGNFGVDVSAWEIQFADAAITLITGSEGLTFSAEVDLLSLVKITLVFTVTAV